MPSLTSTHVGPASVRSSRESDERLRLFLRDRVASYEQLEALLLLAREPGRAHRAIEISTALEVRLETAQEELEELVGSNLVEAIPHPGGFDYRFVARDDSVRELVRQLAVTYADRRLCVVTMMTANALQRVRDATMRRLAAAFGMDRHGDK